MTTTRNHPIPPSKIPIYSPNGTVVGAVCEDVNGDIVLHKRVLTRNYLKKWQAWALEDAAVTTARQHGAVGILLTDDTGTEYRCSLRDWDEWSVPFDMGHGPQRHLHISRFQVTTPHDVDQLGFEWTED